MILPRHDRVILWGLKEETGDSFKHIWRHFAHALFRLDKPYLWLPDEDESREWVEPGDLVFSVDVASDHLGPPVKGVDYLLHNISDDHPVRDGLDPERCVYLQVWTNDCADRGESWGPVRRWDKHSRVLYQPWGTDLLPDEFYPPVFNGSSRYVTFVGSIWDGNGQGNTGMIADLMRATGSRGLLFDHRAGVTDQHNAELVRDSRLAPAVAGQWQVEHGYLPCRYFKNVSYGTLGMTNVPAFYDVLGGDAFVDDDVDRLLNRAVILGESEWLELVREQREVVRDYTYQTSLEMIGRAFEQ